MQAAKQPLDTFADLLNVRTMRRHWRMMAGTTLSAVVMAAVYVAVADPIFESEVRVVIQQRGLELDGTSGTKMYDREFLSTQAEMIRSPLIISQALEMMPPIEAPDPDDNPADEVLDNLRVNLLANTDIIRVTYQHTDAPHATERLRSILESYQSQLRTAEQISASESFDLLKAREAEVVAELEALQQQLAATRTSARTGYGGPDAIGDERLLLEELTTRWAAARTEQAGLHPGIAGTGALWLFGQSGSGFESPLIREFLELQASLNAARADLEETTRVYGTQHPERIGREHRVAVLSDQLTRLESQLSAVREQHRASLAAEERILSQLIDEEARRLQEFDTVQLTEERLTAEIERVSELHSSTLATLEAVGMADRALAEGRASILVNVIDEYVVPSEPIWPQAVPLLGASGLLGLLLGVAAVVMIEARLLVRTRAAAEPGALEIPTATDSMEVAVAGEVTELQQTLHDLSPSASQSSAPLHKAGART